MTQTSVTKRGPDSRVPELLAIISRRASHEVRNALNGVAVNVEVVRSRLARTDSDVAELLTFAERASTESDAAASLATGLADLTRLLGRAVTGDGKAVITEASGGSTTLRVPICSSDDNEVSQDLKSLAARMGVAIRLDGPAVIFTVRD